MYVEISDLSDVIDYSVAGAMVLEAIIETFDIEPLVLVSPCHNMPGYRVDIQVGYGCVGVFDSDYMHIWRCTNNMTKCGNTVEGFPVEIEDPEWIDRAMRRIGDIQVVGDRDPECRCIFDRGGVKFGRQANVG